VTARLLALLPVLVTAVALGKATDDWRIAAAVGALATLLAIVGPRWEVDRGRRLLTAALGGAAGYLVVNVLYDPHARGVLGEGWSRLAAAALLAAAARFLLVGMQGRTVTTALVFVSLLAVGETHFKGYAAFVGLFLVTGVWAPAVHDEHGLLSGISGRRLGIAAGVLLFGVLTAVGATFGARRAYSWLTSRERSFALDWSPRVGFSDRIDLGALDELLDSDTIVLRVHGRRVDYLRGAVLDSYAGGRWFRSEATETEHPVTYNVESMSGATVVKITAVSERSDRFFLPLGAQAVETTPPSVLVDGVGVLKPVAKVGIVSSSFVVGPRDIAIPAPPGPADLLVPRALRQRLAKLAVEWTDGAGTTQEKLDAIERHFSTEFRYARTFARVSGPDPVLDFLFGNHDGHCEYFATAMALVARAAGIPTRFVAGYRVGEHSPFGYYVVRERNAHAWVEAWVAGEGWTTRDPTPESDLPQNRENESSVLASLSDELRVAYDEFYGWLQRRTLEQTAVVWFVGLGVLVWIVARGVRRRGAAAAQREDEAALPCLALLLATLEREGLAHNGVEPIERLAARTADEEGARLLQRYAALRYGGVGDPDVLATDVATYARRS
jgi:transglutaminase-like putative cysteine protease